MIEIETTVNPILGRLVEDEIELTFPTKYVGHIAISNTETDVYPKQTLLYHFTARTAEELEQQQIKTLRIIKSRIEEHICLINRLQKGEKK
jgi:hypothetical protein